MACRARIARPRRIVAALLGASCVALAACGDSSSETDTAATTSATTGSRTSADSANEYPAAVTRSFVRSCTVTAKATSNGKLDARQARAACVYVIDCLEDRLTVAELTETMQRMQAGQANPGARALRVCERGAVEHVLG